MTVTVRLLCTTCKWVEIPIAPADGPRPLCVWDGRCCSIVATCPDCGHVIAINRLGPTDLFTFKAAGIPEIALRKPSRPDLGPLTEDDLITFGLTLEGESWATY